MVIEDEATLRDHTWDVVIIGTGMGGATLGYELARAGIKILFIEKGYPKQPGSSISGVLTADRVADLKSKGYSDKEIKARCGLWNDEICSDAVHVNLGCGTGGTSAIFGMALERFHPTDFSGSDTNTSNDTSYNKPGWPISYEDMVPYYTEAEIMYGVHGTPYSDIAGVENHLLPPPKLHPANEEMFGFFKSKGFHPYQLHMANDNITHCQQCQGYLCEKDCKHDAEKVCLRPAVFKHNAGLLARCEVIRLNTTKDGGRIESATVNWHGQYLTVKSSVFVLAAGAIQTPLILLNSKSDRWPRGLANSSGLIGKNLMLHCVDLYAIQARTATIQSYSRNLKQIAFNDYYYHDGVKLGTFQSFGYIPLEQPNVVVFASIMEDFSFESNRVHLSDDNQATSLKGIVSYHIHSSDRLRLALFRKKIADAILPYNFQLIRKAEDILNTSHACGTCKFGDDAKRNVLNRDNCAHDVTNLFVVDSSFFATSGGTNPSLTIAANAIRVSKVIIKKIHESSAA